MVSSSGRTKALIATPILVLVALTGCSSSSTEPDAPTEPSPPPTAEPASVSVDLGDAETVSWAPTADLTGELSITVEKVREGGPQDFVGLVGPGITGSNQPFYVDAVITNEADADFGGLDVPLYLADSRGVLSPPWSFASPFEPCPSGPLPETFGSGDETEVCLVFFGSPGATFESITFQPTSETAAVRWTGDLTTATVRQKPKNRR